LGDGLHYVDLRVLAEVMPLYAPAVPILMRNGQGSLMLLSDPSDPQLDSTLPAEAAATIHFVPHVHYDLEWLRDEKTFGRLAAANLLEAIGILERDPQATFVVDQVPQIEALARLDPSALSRLIKLVRGGQMEPVMGFFIEPDVNLIGGESLVRQAIYWQKFAQKYFGRISTVGWLIDSFGMCATLPQILRKAGCTAFAFSRGIRDTRRAPTSFMWEGLDGSRIKTHWMRELYFAGYPLPEDPARADYKLARTYRHLAVNAPTDHLFCPAGIDHGRPQNFVGPVLERFNAGHSGVRYQRSLPSRFFAALPEQNLAVITGEFNPHNAGVYAARPVIKQLHRRAETAVLNLERISLLAAAQGASYPHQLLEEIWHLLMRAQFHDSLTGCHTDEVSAQVEYRLRRALELAEKGAATLMAYLLQHIDLPVQALRPILLVNTLPFWREETFTVELTAPEGRLPLLTDGQQNIPYQIISHDHYADGVLKRVTALSSIIMPPLGYRVLWTVEDGRNLRPAPPRVPVKAEDSILTNAWLKVGFDSGTGTVSLIEDLEHKFKYPTGRAGRLTLSRDTGTLYLVNRLSRPRPRSFIPQSMEVMENGPIRCAIRFGGELAGNRLGLTYRLSRASKVIDVETEIDFQSPRHSLDVRVALFPKTTEVVHEIPYGLLARDHLESPALNFADIGGPGYGLSLLNAGTSSHRLENGALVMCLMRSVDQIHLYDAGPGALSLGHRVFRYGLFPHIGDARYAQVYRRGLAFNAPLLLHYGQRREKNGDQPRMIHLLRVAPDSIEVGAAYQDADGSTVIRLIERGGKDTAVEFKPSWSYAKAEMTDLLGRVIKEIAVPAKAKGSLPLTMRAYEIKTLRFS